MTNGKQKGKKMKEVQNKEIEQNVSEERKKMLSTLQFVKNNTNEIVKAAARMDLLTYSRYMQPGLDVQPFHKVYYTILNLFAHGKIKKLIVTMPPQHGKALPIDTPILTTKGWKRHGDLKPGDYVFGDDGFPKKVIANFGKYNWHTQIMTFADGNSIIAAHEHVWKIYADRDDHKGRVEELQETQNILKGRHRRKPYIKADVVIDLPDKDLPIDPYILGLWLGDGLSAQGVIVSGEEDKNLYSNIGEVRKVKGNYLRINGLLKNKHIPTEYLLASIEQRYELLRGLMDTDGYVDKKGRCEFSQMSGRLVNDVYVLLRTLGIKATRHEYDAMLNGKNAGRKVRVTFTPNRDKKIFKLERKQIRITDKNQKDRADKCKFFIKGIEKSDDQIVNCIQVEGGMYLAGIDLIPTHNSEGSSRKLPSFMLGLDPDKKIAIGSYSTSFARDFNRDIQKIIDTPQYNELFPETYLSRSSKVSYASVYQRNSDVIECVGHTGSLRVVGRGGPLTGKPVDIMILDDVYKDYQEANSPVIREAAWKWYTTVVKSRLHNNSQELIVFTRWHSDDIVGRIEKSEKIIDIHTWADIRNIPSGAWVRINFEAIKTSEKTEIDPREIGQELWPQRHSLENLLSKRKLDKVQFDCLYQGAPGSAVGKLYSIFRTYIDWKDWGALIAKGNYTDCADEGTDYLCSINYMKIMSRHARNEHGKPIIFILVTDVIFTDKPIEETTISVPMMMNREATQYAYIESNNGGKAFAKIIEPKTTAQVYWFTQSANKESRIITNAGLVTYHIIMPHDWETRFPEFYKNVTDFLRNFSANAHDDGPDALTGIIEKEILSDDVGIEQKN